MPALIAAVLLIGLLCTFDLILTLGVIKRLREHTELLSVMGSAGVPPIIEVGTEIGDFSTSTVDGESVNRESLSGETLVAFFSPTCAPCQEKLPKFVEYARSMSGGRNHVLAAVVGGVEEAAPFVAALSPVAQVVVADRDSMLATAFNAKAFPTVLMVASDHSGRLVVTSNEVDLEPLNAPA
ncbi:TlpA disulfide reductase family protein [Actinoallomurus sp. NPDC052274]|uniref:TlpA family protein disulfide reductase n=1 Tax=Actinoallomurus sp. NPDC052274 TaxID=3155420 RepID=UPI00341C4048